jgi:hypothetical protein
LFGSEFFFRTTQELEYIFFLSREAWIFFSPEFKLGYMTKTLNQIFFPLHQNQNIFFSNIGNQNIFLEKNHNPPSLQVKWSFPKFNTLINVIRHMDQTKNKLILCSINTEYNFLSCLFPAVYWWSDLFLKPVCIMCCFLRDYQHSFYQIS